MSNKMKKLLTLGTCILLGTMIILTAVVVNASSTSGYEELKTAIKNMADVQNFTGDLNMTVKDNGNTLTDISAKVKANHNGQDPSCSGNATITTNGVKESFEIYEQDNKSIIKSSDSDVYGVVENKQNDRMNYRPDSCKNDPMSSAIGEKIMDFMVGDLKNHISVDENDGGKTIEMSLSEKQIPTIVNLIASFAARNSTTKNPQDMSNVEEAFGINADLVPEMPKLVDDVRIENVDVKLQVGADGHVKTISGDFKIAGTDGNGKAHDITLDLSMELSDVNATTPDKLDLTGKDIKTIDMSDFKNIDNN